MALKAEKSETPNGEKPSENAGSASEGREDIGKALRSVYDEAVNEDIPSEMLDLLGKLG